MRTEEVQQRLALIQAVAENYGRDFSKSLIKIWLAALEQIDFERLQRAVATHISDPVRGHFPPTPAALIRLARGIRDDSAARAWSRFFAAARTCAFRGSVAFDDAALHAAVTDLGGATVLTRARDFDLSRLRKDFDALYVGHLSRGVPPGTYRGALYLGEGRLCDPPRLIGDAGLARAVLQAGADNGAALLIAPGTKLLSVANNAKPTEPI